jgi:hypothetical protein
MTTFQYVYVYEYYIEANVKSCLNFLVEERDPALKETSKPNIKYSHPLVFIDVTDFIFFYDLELDPLD